MKRPTTFIAIFLFSGLSFLSAQSMLDSTLQAFELALNNDTEMAIKQANLLLEEGYLKKNVALQFFGHYNLSRVHSALNDIEKEGNSVDSLMVLSQYLKDTIYQGLTFLARASLEQKLEKKGEAIYFLGKGIELLEETSYYRYQAMAQRDLGDLYLDLGKVETAEKYYQKAIATVTANRDNHLLAHFYSEMSTFYNEVNQPEEAYHYLQLSDSLNKIVDVKLLAAINLLNHSDRMVKEGKMNKALSFLNQGLDMVTQLQNKNFIALFNFKIGEHYENAHQYKKAIPFFEKSLDFAQQIADKYLQKSNYEFLANTYNKMGNKGLAIHYLYRLNATEKQIFDDKQELAAKRFAYKYESQKKQEEIKVLKEQNTLKDWQQQQLLLEKRQQQTVQILLIIVISLLIIFAASIIYNLKQKAKKEYLLSKKNEELHHQKIREIENEARLKTLNAILEGQEKERERISRDLHDSLGGTLSTLQLQFENLDLDQSEQSGEVKELLATACTEVREISHNMMPVSLKKLGLRHAIQDFINTINASKKIVAECHFFGEEMTIPASIQLSIYRFIQEAVNNAIKHAEANSVFVQLIYKKDRLSIMVEDDGKGFDINKIKHSFGLKNMQNRIEYLGGTLNIDSGIGRGTTLMCEVGV